MSQFITGCIWWPRSRRESSHDTPEWIGEVLRIAPLIGLPGVQAAMNKPKRKGKEISRVCEGGNIPYDHAAKFPHPVRIARGESRLLALHCLTRESQITGFRPAGSALTLRNVYTE